MSALADIPPPTHREQMPARQCVQCGAWLRSYGRDLYCDPCATPEVEMVSNEDFWIAMAEAPTAAERMRMVDALERVIG